MRWYSEKKVKYSELFKHNFLRIFTLLLGIVYIPQMILLFPGIPNGDTIGQLGQSFGDEIYNNHHPVLHTWILGICMKLGRKISGDNLGLFFYVVLQDLFLFSVLLYTLRYLIQCGIRMRYASLLMLYYVMHPILQNYAMCVVKDTWYSGWVMLLLVQVHRCLTADKDKKRILVAIFLCMLFMTLFRNDGIYTAVLLCAIMFFGRDRKRAIHFGKMLIAIIAVCMLWNGLVLPTIGVKKGSSREMFSLPFQQTARYVRDYSSEITESERESIDRVLQYDELAERYDPINADPVKITFKDTASKADLAAYFKTWLSMFRKHPGVYLEATWENKSEFFLPTGVMQFATSKDAEQIMQRISNEVIKTEIHFFYPERFSSCREKFEYGRHRLFWSKIIHNIQIPCLYIWILFGWSAFCLLKKNRKALVLCTPLIINFMINIAGPLNGSYTRYMYLYMWALPIVIFLGGTFWMKEKRA